MACMPSYMESGSIDPQLTGRVQLTDTVMEDRDWLAGPVGIGTREIAPGC